MASSQSTTDGAATAASATLLGKRKEPPLLSPSTPKNAVVDAAFQRLFGYSWGTTFDLQARNNKTLEPASTEHQLMEIFGPARTARILNLPWDIVAPSSASSNKASIDDYYNPAAILTTKIVPTDSRISMPVVSSSATTALQTESLTRNNKKMRLGEIDYKNIALPSHMVSSSTSTTSNTPGTQSLGPSTIAAASAVPAATNSNLDNVLSQISGKKELNTVEKSSNAWEGFKETDKTLQDELERNAQSKNAYLVKQDFLNRVDHRKFELEKEERDRERSRRAAESSK